MTRDEVLTEIVAHNNRLIIEGSASTHALLNVIDAYVAAERERLAQAIEDLSGRHTHTTLRERVVFYDTRDRAVRRVREGGDSDGQEDA